MARFLLFVFMAITILGCQRTPDRSTKFNGPAKCVVIIGDTTGGRAGSSTGSTTTVRNCTDDDVDNSNHDSNNTSPTGPLLQ